ncbi:MAG TPA: hypothetical protein PLC42_04410 [Parachlamydiaceae bacterium]|nr:hypothetical protein [Parachlamydiaceae bacterium]
MIKFLTACMFIWTSFLFYATVRPVFFEKEQGLYLPYGDVINIALIKNGKEELLSFDQEMQFLIQLNGLKTLNFKLINDKNEIFPFEKIVIYRFDQNNLNILPAKATTQTSNICLNSL